MSPLFVCSWNYHAKAREAIKYRRKQILYIFFLLSFSVIFYHHRSGESLHDYGQLQYCRWHEWHGMSWGWLSKRREAKVKEHHVWSKEVLVWVCIQTFNSYAFLRSILSPLYSTKRHIKCSYISWCILRICCRLLSGISVFIGLWKSIISGMH